MNSLSMEFFIICSLKSLLEDLQGINIIENLSLDRKFPELPTSARTFPNFKDLTDTLNREVESVLPIEDQFMRIWPRSVVVGLLMKVCSVSLMTWAFSDLDLISGTESRVPINTKGGSVKALE